MDLNFLSVKGAKLHNLKNIDVTIPKHALTVFTGVSGSGKSSLAFDTIYAEGQRRYVESLSTYARQFLEIMEKPDVEQIEGLSPAISIDQKSATRNPRSTVGTITEIYDYLRLLYAKIGHQHCFKCQQPVTKQSSSEIIETIANMPENSKIVLLSPVVRGRKGSHLKLLDRLQSQGFIRFRINKEIYTSNQLPELDENKKNFIEVVVDRLVVKDFHRKTATTSNGETIDIANPDRTRLADSIETALEYGEGTLIVLNNDTQEETFFSEKFVCLDCQISLPEIEPRNFSFNSPHGACSECHGLGVNLAVDPDLVIPNKRLTLEEGAILPWANQDWYYSLLKAVAEKHNFRLDVPVNKLPTKVLEILLYGTEDIQYMVELKSKMKFSGSYETTFEGIVHNLLRRLQEADSENVKAKINQYMVEQTCQHCHGKRLKPESLAVYINKVNIINITDYSVKNAIKFFKTLKLSDSEATIAKMILIEILSRLEFLHDVGLSYLTLSRTGNTLSGGEAQRIRLATQIGSRLSGVLYVLDEPSIGLHQNDNQKLIKTLLNLKHLGNTVIVVEHDIDTMMIADFIVDIGPKAGRHGGEVVATGTPQEIMANKKSLTGDYLSGRKTIEYAKTRRPFNKDRYLQIVKASENNLQNVDVKIPLNTFVAVTGVSGSGKSTLINHILVKAISRKLNRQSKAVAGRHERVTGVEFLDKLINIDQSPIGRTPRSNPATYTGVFTDIRNLMASCPDAKMRGYTPGRFSFNVAGGRCGACNGDGIKRIEMHFLPDVYVTCEVCKGSRYNQETLEVLYRGKNIAQILNMTVEDALDFFKSIPAIKNKLTTLNDVGLGYITLGQSATTLSGGEAQRIKLASELAKRATGKTLYILDEPTTGLHFEDIKKLLAVLQLLVDKGNTVVTIEHNLDVIKSADYIIDMGPDGGDNGGQVVATGTPEEVAKVSKSYTGQWLQKVL